MGMLVCFGLGWPISIAKSLRAKTVSGKSPLFMLVVMLGYICGVIHKILYSMDWVLYLYVFNLVLVGVDFCLYFKYNGKRHALKLHSTQLQSVNNKDN